MGKIRFAFTVINIFMKNQMQDRTNTLLDLFHIVSRCLIVFLLYAHIFQLNGGSMNGVNYATTMWSMFIYFCVMILNIRRLDRIIMLEVKSGNVEILLNKPVNYILLSFYKVIGQGIYSFLLIGVIGIAVMTWFVGVPELELPVFIPTFAMTLFLGQVLGLMIYAVIGLLAFFIQDVRPVHWIVDKLIMILGGSYLPISMFPGFMKVIAFASPFGAVNFASSTVYETWYAEFPARIGLQVFWIIIFGLLLRFVYEKSREKMMVNGG